MEKTQTVSMQLPAPNVFVKAISRLGYKLLRPWLKRCIGKPRLEWVAGMPLYIHPKVLNPVVFRSGAWFARWLLAEAPSRSNMTNCLDLGCGSGVCSLVAAYLGYQVTAVDINPHAVRCTNINALMNHFEQNIEVLRSDLFEAVSEQKFDLILFNPPFYRGEPKDSFDMAWRSEDVFERYASRIKNHLSSRGKALLLLSTDGEPSDLLKLLEYHHCSIEIVARKHFGTEIMTIYELH